MWKSLRKYPLHHGIFSFDFFPLPLSSVFHLTALLIFHFFRFFLALFTKVLHAPVYHVTIFFSPQWIHNDAVKTEIVVVKLTPFSPPLRHKMQNTRGKSCIHIKCKASCLSNNTIRYSISHKRRDNTDNDNDCDGGDEVTIRQNPKKKSNKIFRGRWGQLVTNCAVHTAHGSHVTKWNKKRREKYQKQSTFFASYSDQVVNKLALLCNKKKNKRENNEKKIAILCTALAVQSLHRKRKFENRIWTENNVVANVIRCT